MPMHIRRSIIKKCLNKVPTVKKILIRILLAGGAYSRLRWIYYHIYFFLINAQFLLGKSDGIMKKNLVVKNVIFLLPKYITEEDLSELSEELVLCFKELYPDILVECIYFDEKEFINNQESYLKHIIAVNPSLFVYLYVATKFAFSLTCNQWRAFLRQLDSYKMIISADSIRLPCSYFLNKMKNDVDMIVGLDAPLRFASRKSKLVSVLPSVISQHTFERLIQPNLSISRDIDILIAGSQYRKRLAIADFLQQNGLKVTMLGGKYGNDRMSYDKYSLISCRAKIRIVSLFTNDELHVHLKGHIAEAVATTSLLFVDSPYPTSIYFDEGKEFISFTSLEELLKKIKRYLNNDEERLKVSMAAHHRWIENYSGSKLWKNILSQS